MSKMHELLEQKRALEAKIDAQGKRDAGLKLREQFQRLSQLEPDALHNAVDAVLASDYRTDSLGRNRVITAVDLADTLARAREPQ